MFKVFEMVGNFAHEVFHASTWNEVQDYLWARWESYRAENCLENSDDEADQQLFYSYFSVEEC